MTYLAANGKRSEIIAAGSHWGNPSGTGDHLLAYALPGQALPSPPPIPME